MDVYKRYWRVEHAEEARIVVGLLAGGLSIDTWRGYVVGAGADSVYVEEHCDVPLCCGEDEAERCGLELASTAELLQAIREGTLLYPWKPKLGESYYFPKQGDGIGPIAWRADPVDLARFESNVVCRTRKAAEKLCALALEAFAEAQKKGVQRA